MEKLKADREAKESKHSKEVYSTASSVEIIKEIRHALDAQEQGNDGHDSPRPHWPRALYHLTQVRTRQRHLKWNPNLV